MKGLSGGLANLMKQANQMQMKMKKVQEELSAREFNGSSGGGAMKITVNGDCQVMKVEIDPEILK
ncbi:MAG: YbaB/EbfC family nucleoid-associated protein, partial [Bdellovibrio sp.]